MDIADILSERHSRDKTRAFADRIARDRKLFQQLVQFMLHGESPIPERAAWMMDFCTQSHPQCLEPYVTEISEALSALPHHGTRRTVLKMLCLYDIPPSHQGMVVDSCFNWLIAPEETVAVKVHAMQLIYNISLSEPGLQEELIMVIQDQMDLNTVAFRSRGKRLLKLMQRTDR